MSASRKPKSDRNTAAGGGGGGAGAIGAGAADAGEHGTSSAPRLTRGAKRPLAATDDGGPTRKSLRGAPLDDDVAAKKQPERAESKKATKTPRANKAAGTAKKGEGKEARVAPLVEKPKKVKKAKGPASAAGATGGGSVKSSTAKAGKKTAPKKKQDTEEKKENKGEKEDGGDDSGNDGEERTEQKQEDDEDDEENKMWYDEDNGIRGLWKDIAAAELQGWTIVSIEPLRDTLYAHLVDEWDGAQGDGQAKVTASEIMTLSHRGNRDLVVWRGSVWRDGGNDDLMCLFRDPQHPICQPLSDDAAAAYRAIHKLKRPKTAYMLFAAESRLTVPSMSERKIAEAWKQLGAKGRRSYFKQASQGKTKYDNKRETLTAKFQVLYAADLSSA